MVQTLDYIQRLERNGPRPQEPDNVTIVSQGP